MTNQHPITPPPELAAKWVSEIYGNDPIIPLADITLRLVEQAARWGAEVELEACCEWLAEETCFHPNSDLIKDLRAARRHPKPPTLKEQALDALREAESTGCLYVNGRSDLIRRALEQLND
jgi:hypothetical protein